MVLLAMNTAGKFPPLTTDTEIQLHENRRSLSRGKNGSPFRTGVCPAFGWAGWEGSESFVLILIFIKAVAAQV